MDNTPTDPQAIGLGSPGHVKAKKNLVELLKDQVGKFGAVALLFASLTAWNAFILWNAEQYLHRADQQAAANEKIGVLEGQIQTLMQDRQSIPKTASASARPGK
jgi:hypothetical protein